MARKGTTRWRGDRAENMAAEYLQLQGFEILLRNVRRASGEIDIVARDRDVLVFVEVRLRSSGGYVSAAASIDRRKLAGLRSCARALLRENADLSWPRRTCRFDAVVLRVDGHGLTLRHLRSLPA